MLDFDATDDPIHGQQEGRYYQGYYNHYCFLPLYVFSGEHLLCALLRPANIDGAKHSRAVAKLLVKRIRQEWPEVKIIIRGDSGFCRWKLMRWCDKHGVDYIFGLARNQVLARHVASLMKQAEADFEKTNEKQRLFGEIEYAAGTWDRPRRVIMKAERLLEGPNRRLLLSSFAYVLLHELRESHLVDTDLEKAQVNRIRLTLLKVAARVTVSCRRIMLHLSSSYPYQKLFRNLADTLIPDPG